MTIFEKAREAAAKGGELTRNERYVVDWAVEAVLDHIERECRSRADHTKTDPPAIDALNDLIFWLAEQRRG